MNIAQIDEDFTGVADRAFYWSSTICGPAPWPAFDPKGINVKNIEHMCRPKNYDCVFNANDNVICIDWLTQEDCNEHDLLVAELKRCFFDEFQFDGIIHVKIHDRDGYDEYKYDLTRQ